MIRVSIANGEWRMASGELLSDASYAQFATSLLAFAHCLLPAA